MIKGKKYGLIMVFPIICWILYFLTPGIAQASSMLEIEASADHIQTGDNFTLDFYLNDITDLYGVEIDMCYDPSMLEVVYGDESTSDKPVFVANLGGTDTSEFTVVVNQADNTKGLLSVAETLLGPVPGIDLAGKNLVATAKFHALKEGSLVLKLAPSGTKINNLGLGESQSNILVNLCDSQPIAQAISLPSIAEQTILIEDATPQNSNISPTSGTFDKNVSAQTDVKTTMTLNGNTLVRISDGETDLEQGTDYSVSENIVTITAAYLGAQAVGTTTLTFNFSAGAAQTLVIMVKDSTTTQNLAGDVDGSGTVDVGDAIVVLRYVVGLETNLQPQQIQAANVSGDSVVDVGDAILILQKIVGLIDKFPIQP